MKVNRFVVHELIKEVKKKEETAAEPELILSTKLATIDDSSELLLEEIHKSFSGHTSLKHTHFADRNDKVFKKTFETYVASMTDELFYKFSEDSLKELKADITTKPFATGGYYIYSDYEFDNKQFISVVLLRKRPGLNLILKDGVFAVSTTENLNIDKIAMGFRLNYQIYKSDESERNYIALITNQQDKLSGYFKDWVVAAGVISDDKNTNALIRILNNIDLPKNDDGSEKYTRENFKKACFDFVDQHPDKQVNLKNLSIYLFGEDKDTALNDYANSNQIIIDNEFKRNSASWNKLITIKAKVEGIELNVDYSRLNDNEVDVQEDKNIIIIRSEALVKQIIERKNESSNS